MSKSQPPVFGAIPGISPGHEFANRLELWGAGVHRQTQAGISARQGAGAESIVLSGGYEDDADYGDVILYTGRGGRSAETGQQVADQELTGANRELVRNITEGLPVRVTRKVTAGGSSFYRYAGLYRIVSHWAATGKSGHRIWCFRLERIADQPLTEEMARAAGQRELFGQLAWEPEVGYGAAPRRETTTLRIVRDTTVTRAVKKLYDYRCQVCGVRLGMAETPYAEAAHVQALGAPHHGPDLLENVLCLCPNHHVLFDMGAFGIADDGLLLGPPALGLPEKLSVHGKHRIAPAFLAYHRQHFYEPNAGRVEESR
ncbi:HNH endonuclease [Hymenobacter saemangeumensis]|uniref:HNH endonuclease n=1 Tax=Hymenobacter saemangeumensis TaxID=1084522 RepID=A0ABP8IH45_9BACT